MDQGICPVRVPGSGNTESLAGEGVSSGPPAGLSLFFFFVRPREREATLGRRSEENLEGADG